MESRTYSRDINVGQVAQALQNHFISQGYETQALGTPPNMLVQVRKKGTIRAMVGMQRVMSAQFRETQDGIVVSLGEQKWADKAAVGAVGALIFAPLLVTAAYGTYKQSNLPEQFWRIIDSIAMSPGTVDSVPQYDSQRQSRQFNPPSEIEQKTLTITRPRQNQKIPKFCPECGEATHGRKFCSECGEKLF